AAAARTSGAYGGVREHGLGARTPLAAFFNTPIKPFFHGPIAGFHKASRLLHSFIHPCQVLIRFC
ncbi:MAG: hypothetical protein KC587_14990, partial [Nitrospira sp.]|nr:hypothetical protein [Nitrospira sp.]